MTTLSLPLLVLAAILGPSLSGPRGGNASSRRIPVGAWFEPATGAIVNDPIARLARHKVVLLGETHDAAEHHRWQLHTIAGLYAFRPDLALGFEMFPRRVQPVLDRWTNGELTEAAFLVEVEWERVWGIDPALYLPLFHFARMHRLPMIALNIERDSQKRFAADPAVPLSEREGVGDPAPATAAYRARLLPWFRQGPMGGPDLGADSPRFARFVRAQQFWDRAMAEAIVARRDGRLVVGIMGSGHVAYRDGVAFQLAALGVSDVVTALPWPADAEVPTDDPAIADLLFGVTANDSNASTLLATFN
jgi:uncharacterized iron-regulated protein